MPSAIPGVESSVRFKSRTSSSITATSTTVPTIETAVSSRGNSRTNAILDNLAVALDLAEKLASIAEKIAFIAPAAVSSHLPVPRTLETLPNDLFGIYDHFFETLRPQDFVYATGALRWLMFSAEQYPFTTLDKLSDAVAFDFSNPVHYTYDPTLRQDNMTALLDWLEGQVTISSRQRKKCLALAHSSLQDYLLSKHFLKKFNCDLTSGISYTFIARSSPRWNNFSPLTVGRLVLRHSIFGLKKDTWRSWFCCLKKVQTPTNKPENVHIANALQAAANQGNTEIMRILLGAKVNVNGGEYRNTLQAASSRAGDRIDATSTQRVDFTEPLCRQRVTMAEQRLRIFCLNITPQRLAATVALGEKGTKKGAKKGRKKGREKETVNNPIIVCLLLENGADVNAQGGAHGSALQASATAMSSGEVEMDALLLANGADINTQGGTYGNALQAECYNSRTDVAAARQGYTEIVRHLLDQGPDVNAQGGKYGTALKAAAINRWGGQEVALLLLENGADINSNGGEYGTALWAASSISNPEMVCLLLENGADVNAKTGEYETALQAAVEATSCRNYSRREVVHLLLENGVDPNTAIMNGDTDIVELLLKHGAVAPPESDTSHGELT
ncbi:ankyrin repeat-containing domain protein [Mycena crocata]|nr:ankyrin repeat-containing domain protein [Mycena crocata]